MRKLNLIFLATLVMSAALPLRAQQPCQGASVVVNTPEDSLMLAVKQAGSPQAEIEILQKFAQANPQSSFLPCVDEYLTMSFLKAGNYDQAIEAGTRDLARKYIDLNLLTTLLKAYVAAGKAAPQAFQLIMETPQQVGKEIAPTVTAGSTAEEAEKSKQEAAEQSKEFTEYSEYAFFQLLPRVADPAQRVKYLDEFDKTFPNSAYAKQAALQYFVAYEMAQQKDKLFEAGEKAVAADPDNPSTLNVVADGYTTAQTHFEQAATYAKKALELLSKRTKPAGMSDEQFKTSQNTQMGLAHSTLGVIELQEGARSRHVDGAIEHLKEAADLLEGNDNLQARALYYLGYCYELHYPAQHRLAEQALDKAAKLNSPYKPQVEELLKKVRAALGR